MSKASFESRVPGFDRSSKAGDVSRRSGIGLRLAAVTIAVSALALLAACSVQEKHGENGEKKVDISTPFGNIKVNTDVDVKDTGLPVYPGAQRVTDDNDNDKHSANVNISVAGVGVKVVAIKYRSDDPPDKVLAFYRPKLKDFGGQLLECKQTGFFSYSHDKDSDRELRCDGGGHGDNVELKAGSPGRQHIVSVKPSGKGSEFALVYVQKRGKEGM